MKLLAALALAASLTGHVRPFVGTTNFGACHPGAVVPNGMMSVSPFNVMGSDLNVWDKDSRWWSTPYVYENKFFTGFSHVNLSGVGCPEGAALLTMPTTGPLQVDYHAYGSEYTDEQAEPGYYGVRLLDSGIRAEASATLRTSVERFTFPAGQGNILLNLGEGLTNETGAYVRRVSETEVEGMRLAGTFCYNAQAVFPIYFVLRVDRMPDRSGFWKKQRPMTAEAEWDADAGKYKIYEKYARDIAGDDIGWWMSFDGLADGEQVTVQVGVSFVSCENARLNLDAEQPGFDFDAVRAAAHEAWESDLGRIRVSGGTQAQREVFYTALYHALIHPSVLDDVNGEYPLMEFGNPAARSSYVLPTDGPGAVLRALRSKGTGKVAPGHHRYTIFSLWDTYRNVHQLLTLVWPDRQTDMVASMIEMYREWGWMPKWELFGRETFTMEGDPAICVVTDSWLKGLHDIDIDTAYEAFVKSATTPGADNLMRPDIDPYMERGYIPVAWFAADFSGDNSVSHALEYYVADHALALLSEDLAARYAGLDKPYDYAANARLFHKRSLGYRNYYCETYGTLRPIDKNGAFITPFDPKDGADFSNAVGFHEGSAWNYTFAIPHDVAGYAALMGGRKAYVDKLQKVFDEGLFDPANEPDINYPYFFSYFKGEEWRTQKQVADILAKYFTTEPDGIPGNDDTGTMSAWAVFSMMGFYPDCPGEPFYTLTAPTFDRTEIDTAGGTLVIERARPSAGTGYVRSMKLGGKPLKKYRISHDELLKGGTLVFDLQKRR